MAELDQRIGEMSHDPLGPGAEARRLDRKGATCAIFTWRDSCGKLL
jgi:hypothetical protein